MQKIIEILMHRDGLSYEDARETCFECREAMLEAIGNGNFFEAEEVLQYELGLEPDYIFDLI